MLKILIIDDDKMLLDLFKMILSSKERRIHIADSIASGKELVMEKPYDIYLFDVKLNDGNGIDLALEHKSRLSNKPVILMSGADINCKSLRADSKMDFRCLSKERNTIPELITSINTIISKISSSHMVHENAEIDISNLKTLIELRGSSHFITDEIIKPLESFQQKIHEKHIDIEFTHHKITIALIIGDASLTSQIKALETNLISDKVTDEQIQKLNLTLSATLKKLKEII